MRSYNSTGRQYDADSSIIINIIEPSIIDIDIDSTTTYPGKVAHNRERT